MKIPSERIENFVVPEKDESQTPMKAVWLDADGERLLATDGHMAMRCAVDVGELDVSGLIPVEAFALARKELKSIVRINGKESVPDPWLKFECNEQAVFIENLLTNTTHLVPRPKLPENLKFPNIDAVIPPLVRQPSVTLNRAYLTTLAKSMDADSADLSLWVRGEENAVIMATSKGNALALLMPMKGGIDISEINSRANPANVASASSANELEEAEPEPVEEAQIGSVTDGASEEERDAADRDQ